MNIGMVKPISKKLTLKYSPKEKVKSSVRGLKALHKINHFCYYCSCITKLPDSEQNKNNTATIDHKTPKSRGGAKTADNEVLCCHQCNSDKGHLTEMEYRAVLEYRARQKRLNNE